MSRVAPRLLVLAVLCALAAGCGARLPEGGEPNPGELLVLDVREGKEPDKGRYPNYRAILGGSVCQGSAGLELGLGKPGERARRVETRPVERGLSDTEWTVPQEGSYATNTGLAGPTLHLVLDVRPAAAVGREAELREAGEIAEQSWSKGAVKVHYFTGSRLVDEWPRELPGRSVYETGSGPGDALTHLETGKGQGWHEVLLVTDGLPSAQGPGRAPVSDLVGWRVPVHVLQLAAPLPSDLRDEADEVRQLALLTGGRYWHAAPTDDGWLATGIESLSRWLEDERCSVRLWSRRARRGGGLLLTARLPTGAVSEDGEAPAWVSLAPMAIPGGGLRYWLSLVWGVLMWVLLIVALLLLRLLIGWLLSRRPEKKVEERVPFGWIEVLVGTQQGERYPFYARTVRLGRGDKSDVVLDDRSVSRDHAELRLDETRPTLQVRDLSGRPGGTKVNGASVSAVPRLLGHRDRVRLANTELKIELNLERGRGGGDE